ncbi:unnamed protein product, partial [Tuber aestivum]
REISLVSFGEFGTPRPLPTGLGSQPLFPDDNGFFSVNGPLDLTTLTSGTAVAPPNRDGHSTIHPLITDLSSFSGQNPRATPSRRQSLNNDLNDDVVPSGQRTRSERRSYLCHERGCTWGSSFPTRQAFNRHREAKHLKMRVGCPIPGCDRVGDKGIKRKDNLPPHILKKHGIKVSLQSLGI